MYSIAKTKSFSWKHVDFIRVIGICFFRDIETAVQDDTGHAQTVHSEGPRPQPREAKTVSHLEQAMVTRVTFRMNLIQPSKGIKKLLVVRRSLSLVVLHDEHGRWIKKKG